MICNCGNPAKQKSFTRGNQKAYFWICDTCGRELAEGKAADLLNERFTRQRLGWYQDTLRPLVYLKTPTRMYDLCLLRHSARYIPMLPNAEQYLHGLIEADGSMIVYNEEEKILSRQTSFKPNARKANHEKQSSKSSTRKKQ